MVKAPTGAFYAFVGLDSLAAAGLRLAEIQRTRDIVKRAAIPIE
jgi:hypothetical protein